MHVGELCNRQVVIAGTSLSIRDAAKRMRDYHVGDLVVVEEVEDRREPVGILTDRDIVIDVLAADRSADDTRVGEVMTCELVSSLESEDIFTVVKRMRAHGVRRMPVVDEEGTLVGIITYDDLIDWVDEQLEDLIAVVKNEQRTEAERF